MTLNGKKITVEEFKKKKEKLEKENGVKVIQVGKDAYIARIFG